jgi:hypothetical protein
LPINLGEAEDQRFELSELAGRVFAPSASSQAVSATPGANRLEQALDLSKNVLDKAKRDQGNSLARPDPTSFASVYFKD